MMASDRDYLPLTVGFLRKIGLRVDSGTTQLSFLDRVMISQGGLIVDGDAPVSNILHEAGHLAILPAVVRSKAKDDLSDAFSFGFGLCDNPELLEYPDHPFIRAMLQAGDAEATAWAWAAGRAIGVPDEMIILDSQYGGAGGGIRLGLTFKQYLGIHGLFHAGMCGHPQRGGYPSMSKWLQDASPSASISL